MGIHWFAAKERVGQASLTCNYITLNSVASLPFQYAYKVQVGVDEEGNIAVASLSKERVLRGDLDEYALQNISYRKSYSRICSTELMRQIAEETGLVLTETAQSFETSWNDRDNIMIIRLKKEDK